ncbi:MAG: hypothetical protein J5928_00020 [Firmicutes bacterium]|nr:hypothetical protein [Bacillota bacterium]
MKKAIVILLSICMFLGLASCGGNSGDRIQSLVQGNMDAIYLGNASDEYIDIIGSTAETQRQNYIEGLNTEAEFFCYYFGIIDSSYDESYDDIKDETKDKIVAMYKQVYDKSKYSTKESVKQSDGSYTVQVTIEPIDIMEQAIDKLLSGTYQPYEDFWTKYEDINTEAMSDEEFNEFYEKYTDEYANVIIDCILGLLPELGYKDAKTLSVQVQADSDDIYSINDDDWNKIDDYIIYYP